MPDLWLSRLHQALCIVKMRGLVGILSGGGNRVNAHAQCAILLAIGGVVAATMGCGGPDHVAEEASTLKPLAILYGRYIAQNRGQPPANEAAFRAFVEKEGPSLLEQFEAKDVSSLFVSSRDKKPYTILYGPLTGPPGPAGQPVFAYEQEGVGGMRLVASSLGAVDEVDATKFKQLVPSAP